jgi:tetratricopeptide (TPR) repeat protein
MKGLVLTHMGKREEGIDLVKKGMRFDLTSHICWHVFGLIQKGEKNYEEALKSYTQALRFDKVRVRKTFSGCAFETTTQVVCFHPTLPPSSPGKFKYFA